MKAILFCLLLMVCMYGQAQNDSIPVDSIPVCEDTILCGDTIPVREDTHQFGDTHQVGALLQNNQEILGSISFSTSKTLLVPARMTQPGWVGLSTVDCQLSTVVGRRSTHWYTVTKNDLWIMGLELVSGYAQGTREELLYHPYEFMSKHPNLDSSFWFVPQSWRSSPKKFDANHVLKAIVIHTQIAAVIIKFGDLRQLPKKDRWKKIVFDSVKYYGSYQLGFFLAYNVTQGNPVF